MRYDIESIEKNLNKTLTESWNKFKLTKTMGNINISLDLNTETRNLNISIEENINKEDYFFEIDDRSKGFIWYYNFIMKTINLDYKKAEKFYFSAFHMNFVI